MQRLNKIFEKYKDYVLIDNYYSYKYDIAYLVMKHKSKFKKEYIELPNPKVPIYVLKPNINIKDRKSQVRIEDTDKHYVRYRGYEYNIAKVLGMNNFKSMVDSGRSEKKHIHLHKRLFYSDINIKELILREYNNFCAKFDEDNDFYYDIPIIDKLHIGYFDIETDIEKSPDPLHQPINVITYIDPILMKSKTIAIINPEYKGQAEILIDIDKFKEEMIEHFFYELSRITLEDDPDRRELVITEFTKLITGLDFDISFIESEETMMKDINKFIFDECKPDFLGAYNTSYDINHQVGRSTVFNINYEEMFCIEEVKEKWVDFQTPEHPQVKKREHHFYNNAPTKIVDQMTFYYQVRSTKEFTKLSLDATAERELGINKLDYKKELGINYFGDFPYVNYKFFLMYNIFDVVLNAMLEIITQDIYSRLYTRFITCVEYSNINRSLKRTTGAFDNGFVLQGVIPGNEINGQYLDFSEERLADVKVKDPSTYTLIMNLINRKVVQGGLCSNPNKMHPSVKKTDIYGIEVDGYLKFGISADDDAKSMYPNNMMSNNAIKDSLYGRVIKIDNNNTEEELLGHKLAMGIINQNMITLGHMLFSLPDAKTIEKELLGIEHKFENKIEDNYLYDNIELEVKHKDKIKPFLNMLANMNKYKFEKKNNKPKSKAAKIEDEEEEADIDRPVTNKCFVLNNTNKTYLNYNKTKVTIEILDGRTFNEIVGIKEDKLSYVKFVNKTSLLENYVDEYIEYLIPKDVTFNYIGDEVTGVLDKDTVEKLNNAKIKPIRLEFKDYNNEDFTLTMINNTFFGDFKNIAKHNTEIKYTIKNIDNGKNNIRHIKFEHIAKNEIADVKVTQEIVAFVYK